MHATTHDTGGRSSLGTIPLVNLRVGIDIDIDLGGAGKNTVTYTSTPPTDATQT